MFGNDSDFDKGFARMQRFIVFAWAGGAVVTVGICLFVGWIAVKLLQFYGVI